MKNLLIVESPTKAKTIGKYLGSNFDVLSSKGHVLDLPQKELGVDIENKFSPTLVVQNKKLINRLRKKSKKDDKVYLATDNDREGEAIAYDLYTLLRENETDSKNNSDKFKRIVFNEITKDTIKRSINEPVNINLKKVDAQRARRILDRLVGYLISPLLSKSISGSRFEGLSAGRVQSVALQFIVKRGQERESFEPDEYWEIEVDLKKQTEDEPFSLELNKIKGNKPQIKNEEEARDIENKLHKSKFTVDSIEEKSKTRSPLPPFITSTLQRTASSILNFSPTKTMRVAQQLYEGIELKNDTEGLITYMRTDSTRVSKKAQQELRNFVKNEHSEDYLCPKTRYFRKQKGAQDAHEAIRPTTVTRKPTRIKNFLGRDQFKLYQLIWNRFVATQMAKAQYKRKKVSVKADNFLFKVSASKCVFDGFLKVLPLKPLHDEEINLPSNLQEGDNLKLDQVIPSQHFTNPPPRFSEASLIKELEKEGIGRPSTYANIIHTIQTRNYVYKENGSFSPTLLGFIAVEFLKRFFPQTIQPELTAEMESALDKIKNGNKTKTEVLSKFYKPLKEALDRVEKKLETERNGFEIRSDVQCSECSAPMNLRYWKGTPYLSCSNWPDCKTTVNLPQDVEFIFSEGKVIVADELQKYKEQERKLEEKECPKCGSKMEIKHGRYGRFYACTNPDCNETTSVSSGVKCPRCGEGELVERYSRKRKQKFYGCNNYPDCKFTVSKMPQKRCPICAKGVLIPKSPSSDGNLVCSNKKCNHSE